MAIDRLDHIGLNVDDLDAAIAFFQALGLEIEEPMTIEGPLVDRIIALDGASSRVAFAGLPGGGGSKLELIEFRSPQPPEGDPRPPANAPGLRHLCFAVDDLDATLARLQENGATMVGETVDYEGIYRICYVHGPAGVIVELAQRLPDRVQA